MTNQDTDYLSMAAAELEMNRAALSCLLEVFSPSMSEEEAVRAENMLYLLQDGLLRVSERMEEETQHRMRGKV
ncbi:hypothetical protein EYZ00_08575 [Hafnia paralvei]|uniref:hypothetical protein n=1 Tax=Hafnia paralvei TaxID=546367 RepID=UPI001034C51C|nr:hypothetical protein [Hafnia paralvei]TBL54238.1 hypothetical protein EYZ00_08575 [Hafnia paralvei]